MKTQKALTADLESMHSELESMTRSKSLVPVPRGWGPGPCGLTVCMVLEEGQGYSL